MIAIRDSKRICCFLRNTGLKAGIVPSRQSKLTERYEAYIPVKSKQTTPLHIYYKPWERVRLAIRSTLINHEIKFSGGNENTESFTITS